MSGGGAVGGGRWEEVGVSRPPNFARGAANWASPSPQGRNSLALEAVNATVAPWFEVMRICAAEEGHEDGERQRQEGELRHRGRERQLANNKGGFCRAEALHSCR